MKLPHQGVYVRLKPSPIHGVGVFAIRDIPKGTCLFPNDKTEFRKIQKASLQDLTEQEKQLYLDFCVFDGKSIWTPKNFNDMTPAWFLNESKEPNSRYGKDDNFYTTRDIKEGEELTVDYDSYSDKPEL